jgi:hypothetical protein
MSFQRESMVYERHNDETNTNERRRNSLHSHLMCSSMSSLLPQSSMNDNSSRSYNYIYHHRRRCQSLPNYQQSNCVTDEQYQIPIQLQAPTMTDMTTSTTTNVDEPLTSRIFMQPSMLLLQFGFSYLFQKRQSRTSNNILSLSTVLFTIVLYSLSSHAFRRSIRKRLIAYDQSIIPTMHRDLNCRQSKLLGSSIDDNNIQQLLMIPDTILNIVLVLIMIQQSVLAYQLLFFVSGIMVLVAVMMSINRWIKRRKEEYNISDITLRHALLGFEYLYYSKR